MSERRPVEVKYRGQVVYGEWYVEGGSLHVASPLGALSGPVARVGYIIAPPSELAKELLWKIARKADPKRPLFYWR